MKKSNLIVLVFILVSLFSIGFGFAQSNSFSSVCCEKTTQGGWCINTEEVKCDDSFKISPTSCESTSYCQLGTCYDSDEGICMDNTPENVCNANGGVWSDKAVSELPQCQLGCCVMGDQAAFVPLVRCKKLSSFYGTSIDWRTDINSEAECIATANSQDMGACVYESDFTRTCKFSTRAECGAEEGFINGTNVTIDNKFYKDYLCSAEQLGTDCARQVETGCDSGKVYWFDSCGNRENVYSSDKDASWNNGRVADDDSICAASDGSNVNCGNCDYLLGSRCAEYEKGILPFGGPSYGDYYCRKSVCEDRDGNERINGESWCVIEAVSGNGKDPAGLRHYREVCIDGEVVVEPCADFRNEVCIEDSVDTSDGEYGVATCKINMWRDCVLQTTQENCVNLDKRDCVWKPSVYGLNLGSGDDEGDRVFNNPNQQAFSNPTDSEENFDSGDSAPITGAFLGFGGEDSVEDDEGNRPDGVCVPNYAPGLNFWEGSDSNSICGQASARCVVKFEKSLLEDIFDGIDDNQDDPNLGECIENCECLEEGWAASVNEICTSLGDCGAYINYNGVYTDQGYLWKIDNETKEFSRGSVNTIASGKVIGVDMIKSLGGGK